MPIKRHLFCEKLFLCSLLPFQMWSNKEKTESASTIFDIKNNNMEGKQRLYHIFSLDSSGSLSPELTMTYQSTIFGALLGGLYGSYSVLKPSPEVIDRNKAIGLTTKYEERHIKAAAAGREFVARFCKKGFHWGWRVGIFCGSLTLITSVISGYRGRPGILEYTVAGAVTGAFASWKRGPKTMSATGLMGTAFGTLFGCAVYAGNILSGKTAEENNFWQYGWEEAQLKPSKDSVRKLREESRKYVQSEVAQTTKEVTQTSSNEGVKQ